MLTACANKPAVPVDEVPNVNPEVDVNAQNSEENAENQDNQENQQVACSVEDLEQCEQKQETCIETIEDLSKKIRTLEKNLEKSQLNAGGQDEKMKKYVLSYMKSAQQKEYPFDFCGSMGKFSSKPWFEDFKALLEEEGIFFDLEHRVLAYGDFFGGCYSSAENVSFFLGAGADDRYEMHVVKYNIDTKDISEALYAGDKCTDCPVNFGKREGAYIGLEGKGGSQYRYYFDENLVFDAEDFAQ